MLHGEASGCLSTEVTANSLHKIQITITSNEARQENECHAEHLSPTGPGQDAGLDGMPGSQRVSEWIHWYSTLALLVNNNKQQTTNNDLQEHIVCFGKRAIS